MKVSYSHNNSGGGWWLTDQNWHDLEAAGWEVDWYATSEYRHQNYAGDFDDSFDRYPEGRFLGALASNASREGLTMGEAIAEWERITGQNSADLGCSCCGTPHSFSTDTGEWWSPSFPVSGSRYGED